MSSASGTGQSTPAGSRPAHRTALRKYLRVGPYPRTCAEMEYIYLGHCDMSGSRPLTAMSLPRTAA